MTTVSQIQSHEFIARIQDRQENSGIGLCTGVRLNIGPFRTKDLF